MWRVNTSDGRWPLDFIQHKLPLLYFLVAGKVIVVGKGEVVQAGSLHGKGPSFLDFQRVQCNTIFPRRQVGNMLSSCYHKEFFIVTLSKTDIETHILKFSQLRFTKS